MRSAAEWLREAKRAAYRECPAEQWLADRLVERDAWWSELVEVDKLAEAGLEAFVQRRAELRRLLGLEG